IFLTKKRKYTLKTIFKMTCSCGSTVQPSSHTHSPKIDKSVTVAKESINPFQDYKNSINQMIDERDIETEDDLKELLRCFLDINPPPHHSLIVRAFVDVCSHLRPPHDRRGKSLGRVLHLYITPLDNNDDD
ncbi:hypothetical protein N665_0050s0001, partial [Sinapis alba]